MQGTLQLFRTAAQVDGAAADVAILERFGVDQAWWIKGRTTNR